MRQCLRRVCALVALADVHDFAESLFVSVFVCVSVCDGVAA